jgi:hypothetical protein
LPQRQDRVDRIVASGLRRRLLAQGQVQPGLRAIGRAPYAFRILAAFRADDREHENVERDVVDLLQCLLERIARRAIGIREHRGHPLAVAAHDLHRLVQRQRIEPDRGQLADALVGEVAAGARIIDVPLHDVFALRVGVEDLDSLRRTEAHLHEARDRRGVHALDFRAIEFRLDAPADHLLVRPSGRGGNQEDQGTGKAGHESSGFS